MSENPYQTPESMNTLAAVEELSSDVGLMRNTSFWGYLCVLLLCVEVVISVFLALGVWADLLINLFIVVAVISTLWALIVILFCVWMSKSMTNAWVAGEPTPTITSGSAVLYYFTPILWFWKPYMAMSEVWDNLFRAESSKFVLKAWWFSWLAFWVFILITVIAHNGEHRSNLYYCMAAVRYSKIVAGVLLIIVISKITIGQNKRRLGGMS